MLEDKIIAKLTKHDKLFVNIDKRFYAVDKRFDAVDKRFDAVDKRFDGMEKKLTNLSLGQDQLESGQSKLEVNQDKIIKKLLEHEEKMDTFVTKQEFGAFREEMLRGQDKMVAILERLDDERVFTNKWIKDIEDKVEISRQDIQIVKIQLQIA